MTKKIRLMEDETKDEADVQATVDPSSGIDANDMVVRQLMKYLEAIDWKLWEILKIQKKLIDKEDDNNA